MTRKEKDVYRQKNYSDSDCRELRSGSKVFWHVWSTLAWSILSTSSSFRWKLLTRFCGALRGDKVCSILFERDYFGELADFFFEKLRGDNVLLCHFSELKDFSWNILCFHDWLTFFTYFLSFSHLWHFLVFHSASPQSSPERGLVFIYELSKTLSSFNFSRKVSQFSKIIERNITIARAMVIASGLDWNGLASDTIQILI